MERNYIREDAVKYANKWALSRNPNYYNYDNIGGDCTNFISQCIYAGSKIMNYTNTFGWYYKNANNKSPSWTGVQYLYNFLTFLHSLIVTVITNSNIFVSTYTADALNKNLKLYDLKKVRFIHIEKVIY